MPIPVLADANITSLGSISNKFNNCSLAASGFAFGKSILFKTGTMARLFAKAK